MRIKDAEPLAEYEPLAIRGLAEAYRSALYILADDVEATYAQLAYVINLNLHRVAPKLKR